VWAKVKEEMQELEEEVTNVADRNAEKVEEEFGDLLFSLVNYARYAKVDPEAALEKANMKFTRRFKYIEAHAEKNNKTLPEMGLEEMDAIWNEAKTKGL
jgi:XTP/dITP diphosphohydrolase